MTAAHDLISAYYQAFNAQQWDAMLAMLTEDVIHDANQGERYVGKAHFKAFLEHMDRCYSEQLREIVIMVSADGARAAAEFVVEGTYLSTDDGLPQADHQRYTLPAATLFELRDGQIARVTTYYNLQDWLRQVGA